MKRKDRDALNMARERYSWVPNPMTEQSLADYESGFEDGFSDAFNDEPHETTDDLGERSAAAVMGYRDGYGIASAERVLVRTEAREYVQTGLPRSPTPKRKVEF